MGKGLGEAQLRCRRPRTRRRVGEGLGEAWLQVPAASVSSAGWRGEGTSLCRRTLVGAAAGAGHLGHVGERGRVLVRLSCGAGGLGHVGEWGWVSMVGGGHVTVPEDLGGGGCRCWPPWTRRREGKGLGEAQLRCWRPRTRRRVGEGLGEARLRSVFRDCLAVRLPGPLADPVETQALALEHFRKYSLLTT